MRITEPGIYADISAADYYADPAPIPSLTQSIAKVLIDQSPLHARAAHPRFVEAEQADDEAEKYVKAQAIGTAAHRLMIERGMEISAAPFDSWRSDKAKAFRADAEAAGKFAILAKHLVTADEMVTEALVQITTHEAHDAFSNGRGEVMIAWEEDGIWFRSLVDWLHHDLTKVDDYKTGALSAAPHDVAGRMVAAGWDIQAAMIERGLNVLDPRGAGRRKFRFCVQENYRPYALSICELPESTMTMGRKKLQMAVDAWRHCITNDRWPAYPTELLRPEYPGWAEAKWLDREITEAARDRFPADMLMAG
jgi:hypothetical protein